MRRVAVLQGGPSSEAAVSRASAAAVARALASEGYDVALLELEVELPRALREARVEVVFPALHGYLGEDGCVQGLCEILGLPYVGSGVLASALAADKVRAKTAFRAAGLPVASECIVRRGDALGDAAKRVRAAIGGRVFVKPATQGSAIGATPLPAGAPDAALVEAIEHALSFDECCLCEAFFEGREVTCGVCDVSALGPRRALAPTEIRAAGGFYDFRSRYAPGASAHVCPALLPGGAAERVREIALAAHLALGCRDLSRADFVVGEDGTVTLLEVNTLPGMTATSLYPEALAVEGIAFAAMCAALVEQAYARERRRAVEVVPLPSPPT